MRLAAGPARTGDRDLDHAQRTPLHNTPHLVRQGTFVPARARSLQLEFEVSPAQMFGRDHNGWKRGKQTWLRLAESAGWPSWRRRQQRRRWYRQQWPWAAFRRERPG